MTPDEDGEGEGISEKDVFEEIEIEEQLGRGLSQDYGQVMGGGNSSGSSDEFPSRFNIEYDRDGEGRGRYRWRGANLVFEPDEPVYAQTAADDRSDVDEVASPTSCPSSAPRSWSAATEPRYSRTGRRARPPRARA